jgi:hypothetical protein
MVTEPSALYIAKNTTLPLSYTPSPTPELRHFLAIKVYGEEMSSTLSFWAMALVVPQACVLCICLGFNDLMNVINIYLIPIKARRTLKVPVRSNIGLQ